MSSRVFIDTNVYIYAIELHPIFGEWASEIFYMVDRGEISGFISSLVLMEICWYLESKNKVDELRDVINVIEESRITVAEVTGNDVSQAVELKRLKKNIELNDLINYVIMRRLNISEIFTNDSHFQQLEAVTSHSFNKK